MLKNLTRGETLLSKQLHAITDKMVQRYSDRYYQFGYNIKTLGWGSIEQQQYRFLMTMLADLDFKNKTIVDIGCGFCDYYSFLKNREVSVLSYTGIDINPDLIGKAKQMFGHESNVHFEVGNVLEDHPDKRNIYDIGVMLGLLNVHLKEAFDNYCYSKRMIENAFGMIKQLLIVDFISTQRIDTYPKEDFIFYHDPAKMLEFALTLSDNVVLKHNYHPIPQKEFMLFIYR